MSLLAPLVYLSPGPSPHRSCRRWGGETALLACARNGSRFCNHLQQRAARALPLLKLKMVKLHQYLPGLRLAIPDDEENIVFALNAFQRHGEARHK